MISKNLPSQAKSQFSPVVLHLNGVSPLAKPGQSLVQVQGTWLGECSVD